MRSLVYGTLAATLAAIFIDNVTAQQVVEEIHVIGTPLESRPDELAQSVTVLSGETLERVRAANLGETLAGQVGISASYFGAGASRPIIRGLAGARVRTMEDGIDSMDVSSLSIDHAVTIDPIVAEQIEVFRGPTTLLYGSGAVGGVINTATNRIPEFAPEEGFAGKIEVRGDSAADDRSAAMALDGGADRVAWHFDALTRDTENYEIPGFAELEPGSEDIAGFLENSDLEIDTAAAGASWLGDNGFFGVSVSGYGTNYGLPGHHDHHDETSDPQPAEAEALVRIDLEQTRIDLKGGWLGVSEAIQAINLRVGINDYEHVELEGEEVGTRFSNDAWEGRLEFMHAPWGRWTGAFGLQLSQREFSALGEEAFVPPVDAQTQGVFLIEQLETSNWNLSLGARIERQRQEPSNGLPWLSDTASSVSVAGVRSFGNGLTLAINTARASRLPAAEELYASGPHLASGNIEIGDPDIGKETSNHFDVGLRGTQGDMTWSVTAFYTKYDDFIYLRDTGLIDPEDELPIFAFAQQDADLHGIEAEAFAPIATIGAGEIDLRIFGDFVSGALSDDQHLPRMPPRRLGARVQFHNERVIAGLEVTRYDAQEELAAFETRTGAYTMLNADLNWTQGLESGRTLDFFVRAANLLDEDARRHSSFVKDIAPLPGRNYTIGVQFGL
jgi:iron complex outermembrane receptor protein